MTDVARSRHYRAAVLRAAGAEPSVDRLLLRPAGPGEALVRVSACGLCGSDLLLQDGGFGDRFPVVPGHEASGVVADLGPGEHDVEVGDVVALHYIHKAGDPGLDASARENLGADVIRMGVDVPGAMAEYVVRPSATLVRPRSPIGADELAVLTDAVATPFHALTAVAAIQPGETLGVLGLGGIGSNAVQLGRALGAKVTAIGRSDRSLDLAERLGAEHLIRSGPATPDEIKTANRGGLDVLVVAADAPGAVPLALAACRPGGRVVIVAASHEPIGVSSVELIWSEAKLLGSRGYTTLAIRAVQARDLQGSIQVDHLICDVRPLTDVGRAFRDLRAGGSTRIVIHPNNR